MRVPAPVRAVGWRTGRRAVDWSAKHLKLASYVPMYDYREQLDANTTLTLDARPIRDKRPSTVSAEDVDLTLTLEGLEDVAAGRDWAGRRMLEVGPKYGIHTRWIDEHLKPVFLAFSDFEEDRGLHEGGRTTSPRLTRGCTATCATPRGSAGTARSTSSSSSASSTTAPSTSSCSGCSTALTRLGGEMLLETTTDPRPDSAVRVRWQRGTGKAKMVPTFDALRIELAWTGWRDVTVFTDYRPESDEVLLLCRKTDELADDADVAGVVRPQRGPAVDRVTPAPPPG